MTVKEKLIQEFGAAIVAVLGDNADLETEDYELDSGDLEAIHKKVLFYLDLR